MPSVSDVYSAVTKHYSAASSGRTANGSYESNVAKAFGYTADELSSIPQEANLGLSCGNPLALAALREGETVIDLGSGAGFDVFLAAQKVGSSGQAIGVDMNDDMLAKAESNMSKGGYENVRFVKSPITKISGIQDGSVDCIISNCVLNLVPDEEKHLVFEQMYGLLKSGGRVAISDILIKDGKVLPAHLKNNMALLVGCIAGASLVSEYESYLKEAGFNDVLIVDNNKDLNVYNGDGSGEEPGKSCCGTQSSALPSKSCCGTKISAAQAAPCNGQVDQESQEHGKGSVMPDIKDVDLNMWAGSYNIYAIKQ